MNLRLSRTVSRSIILSILAFGFLAGEALGQANFVSARHETLSQRVVDVNFDSGVSFSGAPTSAGWSVTVNAIPIPITAIGTFGPSTVRIQFDASGIPGHTAGQTFVKPGDVLEVSYVGGGNFNAPGVNAFALQVSQNNKVFTCADLTFLTAGTFTGGPSPDVCAPVVMDFFQFQFKLSLLYRNSSNYLAAPVIYSMTWGDAGLTDHTPYQSDLAGAVDGTFYENAGFSGNPNIILTARPTHTYPATTTPGPLDICSWDYRLVPYVNFVVTCFGLSRLGTFASYDTDNANSGTVVMPPSVVNSDKVCLGTNVNMMFSDNTLLNCRVAVESGTPNDAQRHIRIVYGSSNYDSPTIPGAVNNIPDIRVGGISVTNNNVNGTLIVPTGYFPTGGGGVGFPDFNGVIQLATPVTAATATAFMQTITNIPILKSHIKSLASLME